MNKSIEETLVFPDRFPIPHPVGGESLHGRKKFSNLVTEPFSRIADSLCPPTESRRLGSLRLQSPFRATDSIPQPGTGFAALAPLQTPNSIGRQSIREKGSTGLWFCFRVVFNSSHSHIARGERGDE